MPLQSWLTAYHDHGQDSLACKSPFVTISAWQVSRPSPEIKNRKSKSKFLLGLNVNQQMASTFPFALLKLMRSTIRWCRRGWGLVGVGPGSSVIPPFNSGRIARAEKSSDSWAIGLGFTRSAALSKDGGIPPSVPRSRSDEIRGKGTGSSPTRSQLVRQLDTCTRYRMSDLR